MGIPLNKRVVELYNADSPVIDLNSESGKSHALNIAYELFGGTVATRQDMDFSDTAPCCSNDSRSCDTRDTRQGRFNCVNVRPMRFRRAELPLHGHVAHHK